MTYVYQWFGAVTGWAFVYGCMLGMASQAIGQPGYARVEAAPVEREPRNPRRASRAVATSRRKTSVARKTPAAGSRVGAA